MIIVSALFMLAAATLLFFKHENKNMLTLGIVLLGIAALIFWFAK